MSTETPPETDVRPPGIPRVLFVFRPGAPEGKQPNPGIEPPDHAVGRFRGGLSTKTDRLVEGHGLPLVVPVTVRIDAARRLLERTDDGIARVARQCGYPTVETFHRSFRRLTGLTPGEYRERFRGPVGPSTSTPEVPEVSVPGSDER